MAIRGCGNCSHGKYNTADDCTYCQNDSVLDTLHLSVLKTRHHFFCHKWAEKTPLNISYMKIVSVYDGDRFGGYYIQEGNEYYEVATSKPRDFKPDLTETK